MALALDSAGSADCSAASASRIKKTLIDMYGGVKQIRSQSVRITVGAVFAVFGLRRQPWQARRCDPRAVYRPSPRRRTARQIDDRHWGGPGAVLAEIVDPGGAMLMFLPHRGAKRTGGSRCGESPPLLVASNLCALLRDYRRLRRRIRAATPPRASSDSVPGSGTVRSYATPTMISGLK